MDEERETLEAEIAVTAKDKFKTRLSNTIQVKFSELMKNRAETSNYLFYQLDKISMRF